MQAPAAPDQTEEGVIHFGEEREKERDGGEELFVSRLIEAVSVIAHRPSPVAVFDPALSLPFSETKVPISVL